MDRSSSMSMLEIDQFFLVVQQKSMKQKILKIGDSTETRIICKNFINLHRT